MVGGDARHHPRRDMRSQHLDFTGLRQEFRDGHGQLSQSQKLAGPAMGIMQRQRSVGSWRTRRLVLPTGWMRMSAARSDVTVLAGFVMRVRVVVGMFVAVRRSGKGNGAAIAVLMARMVVRHPSQMRRQQVADHDAQSNSAVPSLHFTESKRPRATGRYRTNLRRQVEKCWASRKVLLRHRVG